ncbi:Alpha-1,4-glucan:maltose-1-phosphate maltosyltransferase [Gemmatirosa kalamazoonensis]|uniref:Alpha-1,4-glucan:maltose-1-phosphate maltosyltransferase n=1 Tax=Gemmatirosa kalamazoonensis TaxID=861299 RepID=W0RPE5_9BACT|nr:alpha-1,4-glucan--maltose-1-phosphate maltosyltransferase [Gemmatirosa kalamazoonensis]AHG91353.1 Alpha-1,4-glucan:maltose-1-phosphate maltosyltransferase [Gemmatirosa kalamazoonensis]
MHDRKEPRLRPPRGGGALPHLAIEHVTPVVDDGRFAPKRIVGELLEVGADIFKDGHDLLRARVRYRGPRDTDWRYTPLAWDKNADRWHGAFELDAIGRWTFTVEGWTDAFGTWRGKLEKKVNAGQDVAVELLEAVEMVRAAVKATRAGDSRRKLDAYATLLADDANAQRTKVQAALAPELLALMEAHHPPDDLATYDRELPLWVDRERAGFAAWYELFPRSAAPDGRHGTFADAERLLPRVAELGFDVVYLPPIHPIGRTFRKGKNNTLDPEPGDVGSPWAIGGAEGGHDAVHPELGTVADFERFVRRANELGLEIALDYALQCAPDHPWVKEHPDWFHIRPDGTIAYAENPPKKYQDIYPINFWCDDRENLWNACRDVLLFWVDRGVKTFRVDNPHTKPFAFWEWAIREVQSRHPDVLFLSEAFTRPKKLLHLAKLGFSQSYGYFTWKNAKWEIEQWLDEFLAPEVTQYHRGNFFANTPDILHEFLVHGGRPAFRLRLLLAATLSPLYGIYSGYELSENVPVRPGSEEYLNSEKYELRPRDYTARGNLDEDIRRLNTIRRAERALQRQDNLTFHFAETPEILFYRRAGVGGSADILGVVNLDPHHAQHGLVHVPVDAMGIGPDEPYQVHDLLTGARYTWRGVRNYVRLDPALQPGHLLRVVPLSRRDREGWP